VERQEPGGRRRRALFEQLRASRADTSRAETNRADTSGAESSSAAGGGAAAAPPTDEVPTDDVPTDEVPAVVTPSATSDAEASGNGDGPPAVFDWQAEGDPARPPGEHDGGVAFDGHPTQTLQATRRKGSERKEAPPATDQWQSGARPGDAGSGTANASVLTSEEVAVGAHIVVTGDGGAVIEPDDSPPVVTGGAEPEGSRLRHPAADLPLPRVLAIANQKGGVGKTTTTVNLGAALAELGYRTLVIDLDPQGNATTGLGVNARNLEHSMYDVLLHEVPLDECVEPTSVRNLFVAPATIDLAGAEIELVPAFSRELRLRRALVETADDYAFTIIDCPPSLGLLTINGLAAATEVVVPIQCEYYALEGVSQLMRNVNLVQVNLNPPLILSAIILTMYDARTKLADQVAAEVRAHFGAKVCRHVVPRTVRLSEAPSFGQPITVFDPTSRGSLAYRELAKEVSGGAP